MQPTKRDVDNDICRRVVKSSCRLVIHEHTADGNRGTPNIGVELAILELSGYCLRTEAGAWTGVSLGRRVHINGLQRQQSGEERVLRMRQRHA